MTYVAFHFSSFEDSKGGIAGIRYLPPHYSSCDKAPNWWSAGACSFNYLEHKGKGVACLYNSGASASFSSTIDGPSKSSF